MRWEKELTVVDGKVRFVSSGTSGAKDRHTAEGLLRCPEELLVWFQDVDCYFEFPEAEPAEEEYSVIHGSIKLRPRKPREPDSPSPDTFLGRCVRLLVPEEGEANYGYVFHAELTLIEGHGPLRATVRDRSKRWRHEEHGASFVRLAQLRELPGVLVTEGRRQPIIPPELIDPTLRHVLSKEYGWPDWPLKDE
jgi:hypothetical protein